MKRLNKNKGFTLVEILIVIAIIGILALVVFIALNPAGRFADARNSNRYNNVEAIGKAVLQYNVDNAGNWPAGIPSLSTTSFATGFDASGNPQCTFASAAASKATAGCEYASDAALALALVPKYLSNIPTDSTLYPQYFVSLTPDNTHVVVMSDDMDINGVSTNTAKVALYSKTF